jgi:LAO/AO transport system kinase
MPEKATHLNPDNPRSIRKELSRKQYLDGILNGDRATLARAITLIESRLPAHRNLAEGIIEDCIAHSGRSFRLGITGVPGVGKSTFIESFGSLLIEKGKRLAILAIDPSSEISKGSILGDKTRMEKLSANSNVFIRPSPASDALGGVTRKTRESIILCEAAAYDYIIVETVGVGQSETAVHSMVDFFLLLLLPGAGDELQGIKRGIVEMADMIAINKADGNKLEAAKKAKIAYQNALHLFPPKENQWDVKVSLCSALDGKGLDKIIETLSQYENAQKESGAFIKKRQVQNQYWLKESINESLLNDFYDHPEIAKKLDIIKKEVSEGKKSPFKAAEELLSIYKKD